jgi:replicative DNA helicase
VTIGHNEPPPHLEPLMIGAFIPRLIDTIKARYNATERGVGTGFYDLDEMLGALRPGSITVVAGTPGAGKTTLALGIAANVAAAGTPTLIVSNKLPAADITQRLLALTGKINGVKLRDGRLTEHDWAGIKTASATLEHMPLVITDHIVTIEQFTTVFDQIHPSDAPTLTVIDRIDPLIAGAPATIDKLRVIATARSCAMIATTTTQSSSAHDPAHQSRHLADLVDAVITIKHPGSPTGSTTPVQVHVTRNRFGPTGTTQLVNHTSIPAFSNSAHDRGC